MSAKPYSTDQFLESFTSALDRLTHIGEQILSDKSAQKTSQSIMETLKKQLKAYGGGIYFIDEKSQNLYLYTYTQSILIDKAVKVLKDSVYNIRIPVKMKGPLIAHCIQQNTIVQSEYLKDFYSPSVSAFALDLLQSIVKIKLCVGIPLRFKGKPMGVLFACFKREYLQPFEWALLNFYASFAGIAIDNSHKFAKLKEQYVLEKEMSSMLAHELKTPIAIAMNNTMMLSEHLGKSSEDTNAYDMNKKSQEAIKRLNRICSSVLTLREIEMQNVSSIHDLRHLKSSLLSIIENFEEVAKEKGLAFKSILSLNTGKLYGGGVQFEQILTILLDNALKYTEQGAIEISVECDNKLLKGTVSNTGYKIPRHQKKAIFKKFYQGHQDKHHGGLGLGLYIASQLTQKLGGTIELHESKVKGNQFIVCIPVYTSMRKAK